MKREKSRAGCMTLLIVTVVVLAIAAVLTLVHVLRNRNVEPAVPVEFPDAPIQADIPPVQIPDMPLPVPINPTPAPAPVPIQNIPAPESVKTESALPPAPPPPAPTGDASQLLSQAREQLQAGDYQAARQTALDALAASPGNTEIESFLNDLAMPLLASQRPMPEKVDYVIQKGDYLGKLAANFNTPVALIAKANNIQGANIHLGNSIRLFDGNAHAFALAVSKSRNDLVITIDGKFFKRYRVSTGEHAKTPIGTFKIIDKIAQPPWHKPGGKAIPYGDPENLLGTHWLALDLPGYGLHGTWDPDSIGTQSSAGCVRLLNSDIEELYTILPKGTLVTISE